MLYFGAGRKVENIVQATPYTMCKSTIRTNGRGVTVLYMAVKILRMRIRDGKCINCCVRTTEDTTRRMIENRE